MQRVLITGGAGFIGSNIADLLLANGYSVRLLDSLSPQVHGDGARPDYLAKDAELIVGDVRDEAMVNRALRGVDAVIHLAAAVGIVNLPELLPEQSGHFGSASSHVRSLLLVGSARLARTLPGKHRRVPEPALGFRHVSRRKP